MQALHNHFSFVFENDPHYHSYTKLCESFGNMACKT